MAELIRKEDTLNQGRVKLNNAILDAEKAKNDAATAKEKAETALAKSENTQRQLDTIVIEGDSSVEAAQARVSSDGTTYGTLKQRLDTEYVELSSRLAQIAELTTIINPSMDVNKINSLLSKGGNFRFTGGEYLFDVPSGYDPFILDIQSNTTIEFDKDCIIRLNPHNSTHYRILNIVNKQNVKIINPTIDGARNLNLATNGEWGHGINIQGSTNVKIENAIVKNCWGDGIYIGSTSEKRYSENITLENVVCDNNRRQGISVVSVKGLRGYNVTLKNTNGTAPESGIDFEPNTSDQILEDIYFDGLHTENNNMHGMMWYLKNLDEAVNLKVNAIFNNFTSTNDGDSGIQFMSFNGLSKGSIVINQPMIINPGVRGIYLRSISKNFSKIIFNNPTIINANYKGSALSRNGAAITFYRSDSDYAELGTDFIMGNVEINNPDFMWEDGYSSPYAIGFYDRTLAQEGWEKGVSTFQEIKLIGVKDRNINNGHSLSNSVVDLSKLPNYTYWPGETPSTVLLPPADSLWKEYSFSQNKSCIVILSNSRAADQSIPLTFVHRGKNGNYTMTIRPPEDERLYPLMYSTANGKGIRMHYTKEGEGSRVTLQRIQGKWTITNIVGEWEAEE